MTKKTFVPAMQFISKETTETIIEQEVPHEKTSMPPMKRNPMYIETRSKKLQLLMQPSLYEKLKKIAMTKSVSVNELIHTTLEEFSNNYS